MRFGSNLSLKYKYNFKCTFWMYITPIHKRDSVIVQVLKGRPLCANREGKTDVLGGKPFSVQLCPPQLPHEFPWDRTRASSMRGPRRWHGHTRLLNLLDQSFPNFCSLADPFLTLKSKHGWSHSCSRLVAS